MLFNERHEVLQVILVFVGKVLYIAQLLQRRRKVRGGGEACSGFEQREDHHGFFVFPPLQNDFDLLCGSNRLGPCEPADRGRAICSSSLR